MKGCAITVARYSSRRSIREKKTERKKGREEIKETRQSKKSEAGRTVNARVIRNQELAPALIGSFEVCRFLVGLIHQREYARRDSTPLDSNCQIESFAEWKLFNDRGPLSSSGKLFSEDSTEMERKGKRGNKKRNELKLFFFQRYKSILRRLSTRRVRCRPTLPGRLFINGGS